MIWLLMFFGILVEVTGTFFLKKSEGFRHLNYFFVMMACYLTSMSVMAQAAKQIPISTIYPVWTGLGTVLVACAGIFIFDEVISTMKLIFIAFIVLGVVGLHQS